jgi:16S rRNA (guanine527-N7)-methyltransferase
VTAKFDATAFQAETGVSAMTMARLEAFETSLREWNETMNLVSPASLEDLWMRHMLDSAQIAPLIPVNTRTIIDFGSGAGFPGLVIAALRAPGVGVETILIESIEKKCAFLRAAVDAMGLGDSVTVLRGRAEDLPPRPADVITARAVASLDLLLGYAQRYVGKKTLCLFLKGKTAGEELTAARQSWKIMADMIPSRTDPASSIIAIRSFTAKGRRS